MREKSEVNVRTANARCGRGTVGKKKKNHKGKNKMSTGEGNTKVHTRRGKKRSIHTRPVKPPRKKNRRKKQT